MKKTKISISLSLLLTLVLITLMVIPAMGASSQPTVNLGTTSTFAVIAGSTITNTGPTTINGDAGGDVALSPGTVFSGLTSVTLSGTTHLADAIAVNAKTDLTAAYNDAVGRLPVTTIPSELGGRTLTPGVYDSADGTFQITGTLTLDAEGEAEGVFIFKTASTLITAGSSKVVLTNSARYCRVFWAVGSSATLGTNSNFVGHIFATASITATTGASIQGQLLAMNGAVTLDSNTITNGVCLPVVPPADDSGGDDTVTPEPVTPTPVTPTPVTPTPVTPEPVTPEPVTPEPVTPEPVTPTPVVTETVTGGDIPDTGTPWYNILLIGAGLVVGGFAGKRKK